MNRASDASAPLGSGAPSPPGGVRPSPKSNELTGFSRYSMIALAQLTLISTVTPTARAQSGDATWKLDWSRSKDAATCPSRDQLVAEVSEQLGRDPFDDAASPRVVVQLTRDGTSWIAAMRRVDGGGNDQGSQQLRSTSADCTELHRATVTALGVMLGSDPVAAEPAGSEPPPVSDPAPGGPASTSLAESPDRTNDTAPPPAPPTMRTTVPKRQGDSNSRSNYLGLQFAATLVHLGSTQDICGSNDAFDCYTASGDEFTGVPDPDRGNGLTGGLSVGPGRVLVSYHHLFDDHVGMEARAGLTVLGRARAALPVHLELGATYWLGNPERRSRAYFGASAGLGAFDTTLQTALVDCATPAFPEGDPNCSETGTNVDLDAVRRAGRGFVAATFGAFLHLGRGSGLLLRDTVYVTFPQTVVVVEPSLGYAFSW